MASPIRPRSTSGRPAEIFFRLVVPLVSLTALVGGLWVAWRRRRPAAVTLILLALVALAILTFAASAVAVRRYRSELDVLFFPAIATGVALLLSRRRVSEDPSA